jgi:hypothetical protein
VIVLILAELERPSARLTAEKMKECVWVRPEVVVQNLPDIAFLDLQ